MSLDPLVCNLTVKLLQESDCCDSNPDDQFLTVEVCDGGAGPFLRISTERFAIDSPQHMKDLLDQVTAMYKGKWFLEDRADQPLPKTEQSPSPVQLVPSVADQSITVGALVDYVVKESLKKIDQHNNPTEPEESDPPTTFQGESQ